MKNHAATRPVLAISFLLLALALSAISNGEEKPATISQDEFATTIRPLIQKYCLECHSTKVHKSGLDLERFATLDSIRKDLKPWPQVLELVEAGEMPHRDSKQPTAEERKRVVTWVRGLLDAEARARAGDPGHVPLRRLSNAEYNATIRDLTGVDLQPAREFPADGAAGEGFTNAAEALADVSPALLNKYLAAAKAIADHAVLLPDGFRFSPATTRRDWTDEILAELRRFYAEYTTVDGRLPLRPYLLATVRYRQELSAGKTTPETIAEKEKLSPKYLRILWETLSGKTPSFPLDLIRSRWQLASEKDVDSLVAEIATWQVVLWRFVPIGSHRDNQTIRQQPNDPGIVESQTMRFAVKPVPGQTEVVLSLSAREFPAEKPGIVVWQKPRFEAAGKTALLLRDYPQFGPRYEVDFSAVFADTPKYLVAAAEAAKEKNAPVEAIAKKHQIDAALLQRWIDLLALDPAGKASDKPLRVLPAAALELLDEKTPKNEQRPAINGWRRKGTDLPTLLSNASDKTELIPGKAAAHQIVVHPTPNEFVGVLWKSPIEGRVGISAKVTHAHPACGNGVAWWVEHRHTDKASVLSEGVTELGGESPMPACEWTVAKGDSILLAVDARDGNHVCDLTQIRLMITEIPFPLGGEGRVTGRTWDLAADVANSVLEGNPHADTHGNRDTWSFVRGPAKPAGYFTGGKSPIPPGSILAKWRDAISDPARQAEAAKLAEKLSALLTGPRPTEEKHPDRALYDNLLSSEGTLFSGLDLSHFKKANARTKYGIVNAEFARHLSGNPSDEQSIVVPSNNVIEVRLPSALFRDREFVVDCKLDAGGAERMAQFQIQSSPPNSSSSWEGKSPFIGSAKSAAWKHLLRGFADFRNCFPQFICFPQIVPTDEVVCLKLYHREDELLRWLFLNDEQGRRLDRLWEEHRFITRWAITEHKNLPLFIGFVTQDQPKELVVFYEGKREPFRKRAEAFEHEVEATGPKQLEILLAFAKRAFRRPLQDKEKADLLGLYSTLRKKDIAHEEAFRTVLARVLVSPSFLFRVEQAPPGKEPKPVSDWELASRLSYFLWSSLPDEELRRVAASGHLHQPQILAEQTRRMLKDDRTRNLAIEFGTQWIHVRGFDELREKNEALFSTFNEALRKAIYGESILFFQYLFQHDEPITRILDADYTFLNETLAKHYGIPGVVGPHWRKVDGVRKYGRGGILGLAGVQTKEAGASRTSPVLRGNWVVETLLGEKLPRPPPNVPRLPEEETGNAGLTMRQLVEKHTRVPECAVCHVRIDPFGFAFEKYDPIGRYRDKDLSGLPLDAHAKLKDGTEFDGIDGLRSYLLTKKKDVVVRLFCRRLLGYALGRSVTLSDQPLIDEMVAELKKNDGRITAAVLAIARSRQFTMIRGSEFEE
jgi:hypothetical protein